MSENTSDETETTPVADDDGGSETEARTRRRGVVILVVVVVVAVVVALVAWSVTSNAPSPSATASASTSPTDAAPTPSASASAPAESAEPDSGEVTVDIREFDETAPISDEVSVALSDLEAVEGEASMPGEIAGPSIRFTVTFTNDSDKAYSLLGALPNVYFGPDQVPAIELAEPGREPFPEEVAPGKTASGTFIYNVPVDMRDQVRITVDYEAAEPALVFEGAAPE
jgi:hypothetical protein